MASELAKWLPSIPYPVPIPGAGYWLPVTSTINWCEEDYYATIYSAEIVNTLTNGLFIALALKGLYSCYKEGHDRVFAVVFGGYAAVGTGSFLFHSTLHYSWQLVDELSMIYTTCLSCYASFSYRRSRAYGVGVAIFLVSLAVFITAYYHYLQDPTFHQRAYALLTATVLFRGFYVMEINLRPSLRAQRAAKLHGKDPARISPMERREQQRIDDRDYRILKTMWAMIACGLGIFLGGFAIWSLDNQYCGNLRRWRREIGLPWGVLLEGHGWWHLMTGTGAYFYITWGIWLRHCLNGRQDEYVLNWPSTFTSLPTVQRKKEYKDANGVAKKKR